jgi:hypothetical protein
MDFAKYLRNEPLTEALAALAAGEPEVEQVVEQAISSGAFADVRDLTDVDREHLRRLLFEPGWRVVLRVLDRLIARQETAMRLLSEDDPLGNRDGLAQGWAYVAMGKRVRTNLLEAAAEEVGKLKASRT